MTVAAPVGDRLLRDRAPDDAAASSSAIPSTPEPDAPGGDGRGDDASSGFERRRARRSLNGGAVFGAGDSGGGRSAVVCLRSRRRRVRTAVRCPPARAHRRVHVTGLPRRVGGQFGGLLAVRLIPLTARADSSAALARSGIADSSGRRPVGLEVDRHAACVRQRAGANQHVDCGRVVERRGQHDCEAAVGGGSSCRWPW